MAAFSATPTTSTSLRFSQREDHSSQGMMKNRKPIAIQPMPSLPGLGQAVSAIVQAPTK